MFHLRPDLLGVRHAPLDTALPRLLDHKLFFFNTKTVRRGDTPLAPKNKLLEVGSARALLYVVNKLALYKQTRALGFFRNLLFTYI
jgi:hypothetical protein